MHETASSGRRLPQALASNGPAQAMAAHSPLSALLAEEAGFDAIWASGFELSALYGLADVSLISMAEHLAMVRAMATRVRLPVVADIDTGFGNAVNVLHAVREYGRAGAAAVVIEDKNFPKVSSLVADARQDLVRIEEFEGKIAAARAARPDPDFLVIARTEALIAGLGLDEALARAHAYARAGADLVLVHSKAKSPGEILAFVERWDGPCRLVLVPTSYPELDVARMRATGKIALAIWGNHAIRSCVAAMRQTFARIRKDGGIASSETHIASVEEVFDLQEMARIKEEQRLYLR